MMVRGHTMQIRRFIKQAALFFIIYFALLSSLIFAATALKPSLQKEQPTEIASAFSKEIQIQEEKEEKKAAENEGKWQPSKTFIITAISIGSVLDVIIAILCARHENKKNQESQSFNPNKWTSKKWFGSMGIVEPKNGKLTISWKNLILTILFLVLLKFWLFEKLESI
jgi:hypothetical protein